MRANGCGRRFAIEPKRMRGQCESVHRECVRWRPLLVAIAAAAAFAASEQDARAGSAIERQRWADQGPIDDGERSTPPEESWVAGRRQIAFRLGFASPVGELGLSYGYSWLSWLESEIGIGLGMTGVQDSFMQKVAFGGSRIRFTAGVGVSVTAPRYWGTTGHPVWLNVDLAGVEIRAASHALVYFTGGVTAGLGGGSVTGLGDPDSLIPAKGIALGQMSIGLGTWF